MEKIDFRKTMKALYAPPAGSFVEVEVPELRFLMVDGKGDPNRAESYAEAVEALYSVAYTLKFAVKKELAKDYSVPPLEGLWRSEDMASFVAREKDKWSWTMMIMVPDFVPGAMVATAIAAAGAKKALPALPLVRLETYAEGLCVQIMHIGPYDAEGPVLKRLHDEYIPANGLVESGHHHEIYLGDPRRTAPEKLKTVLRQPVRRK
jgi:hypothetical protein